jgi:hypothetical protein
MESLVISELIEDGGVRTRKIDKTAELVQSIRLTGFDSTCGVFTMLELPWSMEDWKEHVSSKGVAGDAPPLLTKEFPNVRDERDSVQRISWEHPKARFGDRRFVVIDGNHRIWTLRELIAKRMPYHNERVPLPKAVDNVRLLCVPPNEVKELGLIGMYCNMLNTKSQTDGFVGRVRQMKQMVDQFHSTHPELGRDSAQYTAISKWMGVAGKVFCDAKSFMADKTQVNLLVRVASLIPWPALRWIEDTIQDASMQQKRAVQGLFGQKKLAFNPIYSTKVKGKTKKNEPDLILRYFERIFFYHLQSGKGGKKKRKKEGVAVLVPNNTNDAAMLVKGLRFVDLMVEGVRKKVR